MNRHYGKSEISVMDEGMIKKAVEDQGPQEQAGRIAKEEGIRFNEVLHLRLSYRDILKIDHIWEFTSLTKLELNSNIITKIEGLDRLTNLTWLNLSFNKIEKIEGLESLVNLEVLNLFNNQISVIENMDTLEKLTFFSIAHNRLSQLDNVICLRKLRNLHTLNLYENPISKEENYKLFIAAYFPDLVYLDYRLLDEQTKNKASDKYQPDIEKIRHNELQAQQAMEASESKEAELQLHRGAFVEFLNGSYLFDSMFTDDPEAEKLHCLPGVADLLQTFEHQMVELCAQVFEIGLAEHKLRETEVQSFLSGQTEAVADNKQRAAQMVVNFEQRYRKTIVDLQQMSDTNLLEARLNRYRDEIDQLCDSLVNLEVQLVVQLEDIIKDFDMSISDMVGNFIETVQGIFAQCRDLENCHHEKLKEIALAMLEKVAKNEAEEDLPEDVRMLFLDKEPVMNALGASHDTHLVKINDRENLLVTRVNAWKMTLIKEIQDKEMKRNRKRISEIHNYIDYVREQLEEAQQHYQ